MFASCVGALSVASRSSTSMAATTSPADPKRWAGSFASSFITRSDRAAGTATLTSDGGRGSFTATASSVLIESVPWKGTVPVHMLVEHHAQAPQIAAGIDGFAAALLRGHVGRRANNGPGLGQMGIVGGGAGQPEIEDSHTPLGLFQPDVRRLDVAMDQAELVRRPSPSAISRPMRSTSATGSVASFLRHRSSGFAFQERHDDEGSTPVLADLQDWDDVIVVEGGGGPGLAEEAALPALAPRQVRQHGLDGHLPAELGDPRPGRRRPCRRGRESRGCETRRAGPIRHRPAAGPGTPSGWNRARGHEGSTTASHPDARTPHWPVRSPESAPAGTPTSSVTTAPPPPRLGPGLAPGPACRSRGT